MLVNWCYWTFALGYAIKTLPSMPEDLIAGVEFSISEVVLLIEEDEDKLLVLFVLVTFLVSDLVTSEGLVK